VQAVFRKGFRRMVDSYSGFLEADRKSTTGLGGYLAERGLGRVFIAGLATDFCVAWTALDARALGHEVTVIEDACRGIDAPTVPGGTLADAWRRMTEAGVRRGRSDAL
jgi:nicotinamidase/pyrazinamidase